MTDRQDDIDQLILDIHSAPLDAVRWPSVVECLCRINRADKAQIFSTPRAKDARFWSVATEVSPETNAEYAAEFATEDVWLLSGIRNNSFSTGLISSGEELVDRREYLKTRFYNEFLARHDIDRFLSVVLRASDVPRAPPPALLSLYRGAGKEPFSSRERDLVRRLTPHLIIAVNTFWKARELSVLNSALNLTLDAVSAPLLILDRVGRLIFANELAESELRSGDCLRLSQGRVTASASLREQTQCADALRDLLSNRSTTVSLTVSSTGRRVLLSTATLSDVSTNEFSPSHSAAGIVWIVPVPVTSTPVTRIAALFDLTPAEERLLVRLAAGSQLSDAAETLLISIHTARSQLKAIQRKTGWRTQGELVRMMQQLGVIRK